MVNKKKSKSGFSTDGGQIIHNNAPINQQINIQTLKGNFAELPILEENKQSNPSFFELNPIKKAIAKSETDSAIKQLLSFIQKYEQVKIDEVILIESRWQHLKSEKRKGALANDAYNIEKNRIHESLLDFINTLAA
jgi:hypothetical protein